MADFFARQLACWPDAARRYEALGQVRVRVVDVGGFPVRLQYNPARAVSSGAKVDAASIAARPCFLCASNRPAVQIAGDMFEGIHTLVNPFPIFSRHLTLAGSDHRHQDTADFAVMATIAQALPGMVTFYNGSKAGASAPDHMHFQAGEKDFLPVCAILEHDPGQLLKSTDEFRAYFPDVLPVNAVHFVSRGFSEEMRIWTDTLLPPGDLAGMPDRGMRNLLMWADSRGDLHTLFMPRSAHRPACYSMPEGEGRLMVSPGAVDMAGVLILPRLHDYEAMTRDDIRRIYDEVSFRYRESACFRNLMLS